MKLHVVSFQVPFPPDYGGLIDVYYKLKALKEAGDEIEKAKDKNPFNLETL